MAFEYPSKVRKRIAILLVVGILGVVLGVGAEAVLDTFGY